MVPDEKPVETEEAWELAALPRKAYDRLSAKIQIRENDGPRLMRSNWPNWSRHVVVVVGGGASLSDQQLEVARCAPQTRVITVNNSYQRAPWADVFYSGDLLWWKIHIGRIRALKRPAMLVTQDSAAAERYKLLRVKGVNREGLGTEFIHNGGNSGHQAVNLAYLWGAKHILLLGFDMCLGPAGEKHWHGDHEAPLVQSQLFEEWIHKFEQTAKDLYARGVSVTNCSPYSAMNWFPYQPVEEILQP